MASTSVCEIMLDLEASHQHRTTKLMHQCLDEERDERDSSFDESNAPSEMVDTSLSSTGSDLESPEMVRRRTANTETSILNITEEDDEEDEEEDEFIIEDGGTTVFLDTCDLVAGNDELNEFAPIPSAVETGLCHSNRDTSLMDRVMDNFMDNMCFPKESQCGSVAAASSSSGMESNMIQLLGCIRPPDSKEEEVIQSTQNLLSRMFCVKRGEGGEVVDDKPHRLSTLHRCKKVRQLLQERGFEEPVKFNSVNSYRSPRRKFVSDEKTGYDSDPEDILRTTRQRSQSPRSITAALEDVYVVEDDIHPVVQSSLNRSWVLTWHDGDTPKHACVWMERGTLVHNSMIEPRLMWRSKPWEVPQSIPLLHISRVRRCTAQDSTGLLVQPSTSILVKAGGNNYVFQAPNPEARDAVLLQWRLTVARFATLAVLEDANALLREFFNTAPTTPFRVAL